MEKLKWVKQTALSGMELYLAEPHSYCITLHDRNWSSSHSRPGQRGDRRENYRSAAAVCMTAWENIRRRRWRQKVEWCKTEGGNNEGKTDRKVLKSSELRKSGAELAVCPAIAKLTCMRPVNKDLPPVTEQVGSASLQHQAAHWLVKPASWNTTQDANVWNEISMNPLFS